MGESEEFKGKAVLVTGAAGTIGAWIVDAFARRGASLVVSDRRGDQLRRWVDEGRWGSANVIVHDTELRDPGSIQELASIGEAEYGCFDVVVNNAGIYPYRPLLDVPGEEWRAVLDVNVTAPFEIIKVTAAAMRKHERAGSIVNIISSKAVTVSRDTVAYSTSKAALAMLTRGAALELAPYGIRVNGVAPGFAPGSEVSTLSTEYIDRVLSVVPLRRASGPHDAPEMVVYLSSERAAFITGALIPVDGGRLAGPESVSR